MLSSARMEFHVSRQARNRYQFDLSLFSYSGNVIFTNFHAARVFAQRMNEKRDVVQFPERAVQAGQINAMGLIDEILHLIIAQYRQQVNPNMFSQAMDLMLQNLGETAVTRRCTTFLKSSHHSQSSGVRSALKISWWAVLLMTITRE